MAISPTLTGAYSTQPGLGQSSHQGKDTVGSPVMVHPFYVNIYTQNTLDQRVLEGIQGNTNFKFLFETFQPCSFFVTSMREYYRTQNGTLP